MTNKSSLENLALKIQKILLPIKPTDGSTNIPENAFFKFRRTDGGRSLPEYYLVYFLFVDLLKYKNLGQWEKVAWVIPIDYKGQYYTIEYRKFGLGIFGPDPQDENSVEICGKILKAVKVAEPYFEMLASSQVNSSRLNVKNNSNQLYSRFVYFLKLHKSKAKKNASKKAYEGYKERQKEGWLATLSN